MSKKQPDFSWNKTIREIGEMSKPIVNQTNEESISVVNSSDILILLERKHPTLYEIHRGKIEQSKNLILTTKDKQFAERLVNGYNHYC